MGALARIRSVLSGGAFLLIATATTFGPTVVCLDKIIEGNGGQPFRLGNVPIPIFQGAGATYLDVFILDMFVILVLLLGIYYDYREYLLERDFRERYGKGEKYRYLDHLWRPREVGSDSSGSFTDADD